MCEKKSSELRGMGMRHDMELRVHQHVSLYDVSLVTLARATSALTVVTAACPGRDITGMITDGRYCGNITCIKFIRDLTFEKGY